MSDYVVRGTALNDRVRVFGAYTTELVEELRTRHQTYPVVTAALGRTATMGAIMGLLLKGEEKVTIQIDGGGPVGRIVVDANAHGEVRGYVTHPDVLGGVNEIGKLDVRGIVGTEGYLSVIKDLGMREPYRGQVELISGEIAEDFAYYFTQSEQTPSAVGLGVLLNRDDATVRVAGGFLIQLLPGIHEEEIAEIEQAISSMENVTTILRTGITPEEMLEKLIPGEIKFMERTSIRFQCTCNRERLTRVLLSLGTDELQSIVEEQGEAEVVCTFCREKYLFSGDELRELISGSNKENRADM